MFVDPRDWSINSDWWSGSHTKQIQVACGSLGILLFSRCFRLLLVHTRARK